MALAVRLEKEVKRSEVGPLAATRPRFGGLLSGAITLTVLTVVISAIFRLTLGLSPWPFFVLGMAPGLALGLLLIELTSPGTGN